MNHSGKWTATEFDYNNSNFDRIYIYLHRECHFLLTFRCAVFCVGLLVCVFTLLVLMWFYLFDWLLNMSSSPSVDTTHADSVCDHNTETWKHRGEAPKPPILVSLCSHCVFRLFLASPSISLFWHTPKHGYETQEVRVTVVCSLLTRCLEVKFLLILTLVLLLREMSKTTRCKFGNKQTTEKREHKNTPKKIFLFC